MPASVFRSGAWHPIANLSAFKSGAWHPIINAWVFKAGTWHQFGVVVQLFATNANRATTAPTNANAQLEIRTDSHLWTTNVGGTFLDRFAWLSSTNTSAYEAALTYLSGDALTSGAASGVFVNLGTTRNWGLLRTAIGNSTNTSRCDIRPAGGGTILATATMTFSADKS